MWISKVVKSAKTCYQRILVGFVKKQLKISQVRVPYGIPLATEDILQLIKHQCDTEEPRGIMHFSCNKAQLGCTVFCVCLGSIAC